MGLRFLGGGGLNLGGLRHSLKILDSGGGSAFDLSDIAGLIVNFDSSVSASVYQDAALTTLAVNDADPVGGLKDLSVNNYHATQATESLRLKLETSEINGKNVVQGFGGTTDARLITGNIAHGIGTGAFYWAGVVRTPVTPANFGTIMTVSGGALEMTIYQNYFYLNIEVAFATPVVANTNYVLEVTRDASGNIKIYANGVLGAEIVNAVNLATGVSYLGGYLGHRSLVKIGQTVLYAGIEAVNRRLEVQSYLKSRWGISF